MQNLSIFDEEFNLLREPEEDRTFDLALEISNKLKGNTTELSQDAEELVYAANSRIRSSFLKAMLFVDAPMDMIVKATDMREDLIKAFKEIFFDTSLLRGQLGKTEYYEDIFYKYPKGTEEHSFGIILRDAHLGGPDVVLSQFNIELDDYGVAGYKSREQKILMWQLKETDRGDRDYESLHKQIKARKEVLSAIKETTATSDKHKQSDLASLIEILADINNKDLSRGEKQVRRYNVETEEFIDVEPTLAIESGRDA